MKVICDTNVWYNISSIKVPSKLKEYELCGTIESVEELSMTTNLFSNLARTLVAIKSLHSNTRGIIKFTPGEYRIGW